MTTLHSINLPESVSSLLEEHASDLKVKHLSLEARSTESYVYDFLSTVLDLNSSMGPSPDDQEDEEPTFSQRRGRRGDHTHRDPSSDDRSDSAVAGLSTSPETYRNAEMKSKMDQKRPNKWEKDMEKRQAWLDLIMKNFPKGEKPIDIGAGECEPVECLRRRCGFLCCSIILAILACSLIRPLRTYFFPPQPV